MVDDQFESSVCCAVLGTEIGLTSVPGSHAHLSHGRVLRRQDVQVAS